MSACVDCVDMFWTLCTCWLEKNVGHKNKKNWKVCSSLHVNVVIPKKSVDVDRAWFLLLLQLFFLKYESLLWKPWLEKITELKQMRLFLIDKLSFYAREYIVCGRPWLSSIKHKWILQILLQMKSWIPTSEL